MTNPQLPNERLLVSAESDRVAQPERLVGFGFRCWMSGLSTGDMAYWEEAYNAYSNLVGHENAKPLLLELSGFVRAVTTSADRKIECSPRGCPGYCRDECLAISIIAAAQHDNRPALRVAAEALAGSAAIGDVLNGAQSFACALTATNQRLSAKSACAATCRLRLMPQHLS